MRMAYLFVSNVQHEEVAHRRGEVPSHRLFFAVELRELGHDVHLCPWRVPSWVPGAAQWWKVAQAIWCAVIQGRLDAVVCTHEAAANAPLLLKAMGVLRVPVVVLTVAATGEPYRADDLAGRVRRRLLREADRLCTFSSAQVRQLAEILGIEERRVSFVPLGVDTDFFRPRVGRPRLDYVLAVGTNEGKDYPTLVRALSPGERLVVVTDEDNISQARAVISDQDVTFRSHVPISELREMYLECRVMVLPLRDIGISTGQTVLLENLASGTPVVVSDIPAIADYVGGGANPVVVPPGDVAGLRRSLQSVGSAGTDDTTPPKSAKDSADLLAGLIRRETVRGSS